MLALHVQPLTGQLGGFLTDQLARSRWESLDVGVAWVRRSGTKHILPSLASFIKRGGSVRITAGLDMENTSREGLEDLLSLERYGSVEIFVFHDEAGHIYHPKVYVFSNSSDALVIVGSNNLTEPGLYSNSEASLAVQLPITDPFVQDAKAALASWRDTSRKLAFSLDSILLKDLVDNGYVMTEAEIKKRQTFKKKAKPKGKSALRIFGSQHTSIPHIETKTTTVAFPPGTGDVLLMRLRKASPTERPTQTQIPQAVFRAPFFAGVTSIVSSHSGQSHRVIVARARGIVNTLKMEIPEMRDFADPVVRFERTHAGIQYCVYDSHSSLGAPIRAALERGLMVSPPITRMTKPGNPASSTWWRFV